jgi:hypothetical protein
MRSSEHTAASRPRRRHTGQAAAGPGASSRRRHTGQGAAGPGARSRRRRTGQAEAGVSFFDPALMSSPIHSALPSAERLVRTLFWTLWVLTVVFTAYALAVESFGIGLFLHDQHVPKLHMRGEAHIASALGSITALGLAIVCAFVGRWSRPLRRFGVAALAFWLFYLAIPRY